jgi:Sodium/hydrogen exchanger family
VFRTELFLFQIAIIVAASRLAAWLFAKIGQPQVVGEMAAGIVLGPTLLGYVAPHVWKALLPPESLGYLNAVSQAGLVVFVFLIGVRVDFGELRALGRATITGGTAAILVPLLTGWSGDRKSNEALVVPRVEASSMRSESTRSPLESTTGITYLVADRYMPICPQSPVVGQSCASGEVIQLGFREGVDVNLAGGIDARTNRWPGV